MKTFGFASAAGAVFAGALLFASSVNADVDPIVIKVSL
jgi:HAMP domain-containing protein